MRATVTLFPSNLLEIQIKLIDFDEASRTGLSRRLTSVLRVESGVLCVKITVGRSENVEHRSSRSDGGIAG